MTDATVAGLARRLDDLEREVTRLRDLEEIRAAIYGYARAFDRADEDMLNEVYHDDAYDNHGNWAGDKEFTLKLLLERGRAKGAPRAMHHMGNMLIDLQGDVAHVETYFLAFANYSEGGKAYTRTRAGRYLDRFEKRDGRWRVKHRQVADDWSRLDEVVQTCSEANKNPARGTRDRSDPSYRMEGYMAKR